MYTPISDHNAIPAALSRPLAASAQVTKGNFVTVSPSTGYAIQNNGTTANQICAGIGDYAELSDTSATAGLALARTSQRFCWGLTASTASNDGFTEADWGVPFYIAGASTPGKLAVSAGGVKRSIGGLVFGLDELNTGTPVLWAGPIASLVARSTIMAQSVVGAWVQKAADGAASTATSETVISREPWGGVVTAIKFTSMTAITANNTDYAVINVYKADGAGGTHVLLGSYDTRITGNGAVTAGVPASFTLTTTTANLTILPTDIVTYEITKGGSGQVVGAGSITVVQKVI